MNSHEFNVGQMAISKFCSLFFLIICITIPSLTLAQVSKIFWVNQRDEKIQSSNLDGSSIEDIVTIGLSRPFGISVDYMRGKIYWTDWSTNKIQRCNIDGSNVEDIITSGLDTPLGIEVDPQNGKIYWVDGNAHSIHRANLNGSNVETLISNISSRPVGITVDSDQSKMYWTEDGPETGQGRVRRANTNGDNIEDLTSATEPNGIALDVIRGRMYWVNESRVSGGFLIPDNHILRANLDGSNPQEIVSKTSSEPFLATDIAVDVTGDKIYWTEAVSGPFNRGFEKIRRADLDGSNIEDLITDLGDDPTPISIALLIDYTPGNIVADFTGSPTSGTAPLTVQFSDQSSGAVTSRLWDFGDGQNSTNANPSHTYQNAGSYTVKLTVTGPEGSDTKIRNDYITVTSTDVLVADFKGSPTSGEPPLSVEFSDQSTGTITSRLWDFGDGETSTTTNPTHTYQNSGVYTISLTVSGPDGTNTATKPNYITVTETSVLFSDVGANLTPMRAGNASWGDYNNDGFLDVLTTGRGPSQFYAIIYRNNGDGTFTDIAAGLPPVAYGDVRWGDYDNDADLDILLSGWNGSADLLRVYRNDGNGAFSNIDAGLQPLGFVMSNWGDYDNDGDLDIFVSGLQGSVLRTVIYQNDGSETFTFVDPQLATNVDNGSMTLADYDNDSDLDLLLTGSSENGPRGIIYRNDGKNRFLDINAGIKGVYDSSSGEFGDYDNDGDLDILITGRDSDDVRYAIIYRNDGDDTFTDIEAGLIGSKQGKGIWGDFDNDGDLDIVLTGFNRTFDMAKLYRNDNNDTFVLLEDNFPDAVGPCAFGDFDNDNDLDILFTGWNGGANQYFAKVYRNNAIQKNSRPTAPSNLVGSFEEGLLTLEWDPGLDVETPQTGLSYNLRIGTTISGSEIMSAHSNQNGERLLATIGNVGQNTTWSIQNVNETAGIYWSVQTIDTEYEASEWSTAQIATSVNPNDSMIPESFKLSQNYPNPFNPETMIRYQLPKTSKVRLEIYNLAGQIISLPVNKEQSPGIYSVTWNGKDEFGNNVASGVYLYRLITENFVQVKKLALVR